MVKEVYVVRTIRNDGRKKDETFICKENALRHYNICIAVAEFDVVELYASELVKVDLNELC